MDTPASPDGQSLERATRPEADRVRFAPHLSTHDPMARAAWEIAQVVAHSGALRLLPGMIPPLAL